ncbi:MAG: 30S ribosomal protein S6--L-glutamate ligase [Gemmatimonadota bacterium]|nr:30S ribosomal protein S6--L-glutamate ligase [Gemmatimonadota bacterium]MDH5758431.1 30S ribosomal protein S6--L-glutamate ligase [Gemmatimonadota bacterium]
MKIGILSSKASLYSTSRLRQAAEERGHDVEVVNPLQCYMNISVKRPKVMHRGGELSFDAIIPRIGASKTFYGTAVVRQFEMMGVFTVAESQAISRSRDKLRSMQLLSREGVGLPVTGFARSPKDLDGVIQSVGGPPLIIKLLEGTQGMGVVLAETRKAAESVIGAFRQLDANILLQEYIKEAKGSDLRALVVGGRVVAAMERHAAPGEFRSNLHRGGTSNPVTLSAKERNTAIRAARVMGLGLAGVDLLRSERGPLVIEVNSSPGLQGIETTTGVDVAGEIIEYIENHATHDDDQQATSSDDPRPPRNRARSRKARPASLGDESE